MKPLFAEENLPTNQPPKSTTTKDDSKSPSLVPEDCSKCHRYIVRINSRNGAAHYSKISCIDCHEGHPPMKREIIPRCSKCHTDTPHFNLKNCNQCHTNPHTPLDITLTREITFECTTCHTGQLKELQDNPSIHTTLDCTACHTRHGYKPECFQCHGAHIDTMTQKDCLDCHKPHMPLDVNYNENIPSEFCGSCHIEAYQILSESLAKHRQVPCVKCHESKHKNIPACSKCHPNAHSGIKLENFGSCKVCHGIAHKLKLNKLELMLEQKSR